MNIDFKLKVKDFTKDRYKTVYPLKEGMRLVESHEGLFGFLNVDGDLIIPCIYPFAESFSEEKALVRNPNTNQIEYINKEGITVVGRLNLTHAESYHENRARVCYGTGYSFIDQYGNSTGNCTWDKASDYSEGLALVKPHDFEFVKEKRPYVIDLNGNIIFFLPSGYSFESYDLPFYGGYTPLIAYSYREKARHEIKRFDSRFETIKTKAFIDKNGTIISDKDEVEKISIIYEDARKKATHTEDIPLNLEKLIWYCSTITYPNGSITLQAAIKDELNGQKREVFNSLLTSLDSLKKQVTEESNKIVLERKKHDETN